MDVKVRQLYETHIEKLDWSEKLELLELLIKSTMEMIGQEKEKVISKAEKDAFDQLVEKNPTIISETDLTVQQQRLLKGPVMAEEDYIFYKEKKEHFAQWK